jgi:MoxR-like ATPase
MATMNPLDADGTYALPLAQLDRFLLKVRVDFPSHEEERAILDRFAVEDTQPVTNAATLDDVREWRKAAHAIHLDEKIKHYIVDLVTATRKEQQYIEHGASPRATLALAFVSRAKALLAGRDFVIPDDVRSVAALALRHRVSFSHRLLIERMRAEDVLASVIGAVPAP